MDTVKVTAVAAGKVIPANRAIIFNSVDATPKFAIIGSTSAPGAESYVFGKAINPTDPTGIETV